MLLEMAADAAGDRTAFGSIGSGLTYASLLQGARRTGTWLVESGAKRAGLVDLNSDAIPLLVFGSAFAGIPFVPVNFRLADDRLRDVLASIAPATVVVDPPVVERTIGITGIELLPRKVFRDDLSGHSDEGAAAPSDGDDIAVLLFTSGTTAEPKAAVLRHKHLVSYVISTVEFMGSTEDECALVSVPAYHVAGISAVLTSVYGGRRVAYLETFDPDAWVRAARDEAVTHAMVVPTMLGRILDVLEREGLSLPALRHLSYGGGRMPVLVIERALGLLPGVDFVNAYGLTETSSTIAVLGPDDHRQSFASDDPPVRRRLGSVGRPLPSVELEIRDSDGAALSAHESGEVWVRGEQVSGEYLGIGEQLVDGWFPTHDSGYVDSEGYLFVEGRLDDVIVRGGENISPGEVEEVLLAHPSVAEVGVVGIPDTEWGETVAAAVVLHTEANEDAEQLRAWVRQHLRSTRTPEVIDIRAELPYTETGKLLRRVLRAELADLEQ
jgi:acyl-CoA synthetase (AMP-forming)/AMP-acid ligase II